MKRRLIRSIVVAAAFGWVCVAAGAVRAESPSALLEKAIYTEETVGDLDAAVKLYRQAVDEAKKVQAVAAKAQYRLGMCLLKQGDRKQGVAVLEELVRRYPEEKTLTEAARKHLPPASGLRLSPAPWADGETLHYRVEFVGGKTGTSVLSVGKVGAEGGAVWCFRVYGPVCGSRATGYVEARVEDLRPLRSQWGFHGVGSTSAIYLEDRGVLTQLDDTTRLLAFKSMPYDQGERDFLLRSLSYSKNDKIVVPFISLPENGRCFDCELQPRGVEIVTTPVGKYECTRWTWTAKTSQRIETLTFWISNDAHRYLVKEECDHGVSTLTKVEVRKAGESTAYENADLGISLRLLPDWHAYCDDGKLLHVLQPDASWNAAIKTTPLERLAKEERVSPRAWAEKSLNADAELANDRKVQENSWDEKVLAGRNAVACAVDYTGSDGRAMTRYSLRVFGKTKAVDLQADGPRGELKRLKQAVAPLAESLQVK